MYSLAPTLARPDDPAWCHDYGYSPIIAGALTEAYRLIKLGKGNTASFLRAAARVIPHLKARMSTTQRLRLYFIMACAYAADSHYSEALSWIDKALMVALRLKAVAVQIDLLDLRASFNRGVLLIQESIADRQECLALLDTQSEMFGIDDVSTRLHNLSHLAGVAYSMEQYDLAERSIAEVRALAPRVPDSEVDVAGAEWIQALLYLLQGQPERALRHLLSLREPYMRGGSLASQDRLEFLIASAALEWAESLPAGSDRQMFVTLAGSHLCNAEQLAKEAHDRPGQCLARIARAQYSRLRNSGVDRIALLESVARQGTKLGDIAIQAQALIGLGNELMLAGDRESGLNLHRQVIQMLDGSQVPVLARPARRALLLDKEMHVN